MTKRSYSACHVVQGIRAYHTLQSFRKASVTTGVPRSTLCDWVHTLERRIRKKRRCRTHRASSKRVAAMASLRRFMEQDPFRTIGELRELLRRDGIFVSSTTTFRALRSLNMTYKKAYWRFQGRDVTLEVASFRQRLAVHRQEGCNIVSIDETAFMTNRLPGRGYAPKGEKLCVQKKMHVSKVTCIAAISADGRTFHSTFPGNANTSSFASFIQRIFPLITGSVVLLDNVAFHKSLIVSEIASRYGVRILYTPPYSPQFNPIENFFSALKHEFRRRNLRSTISGISMLEDAACNVFETVSGRLCIQNFFRERREESMHIKTLELDNNNSTN
jgi:transposase